MRNSIFDWVRNLQRLIFENANRDIQFKMQITRVDKVDENATNIIQMTTNEFEHLPKTAEMLERLMPRWKIRVYSINSDKCIIYVEKKEKKY